MDLLNEINSGVDIDDWLPAEISSWVKQHALRLVFLTRTLYIRYWLQSRICRSILLRVIKSRVMTIV